VSWYMEPQLIELQFWNFCGNDKKQNIKNNKQT